MILVIASIARKKSNSSAQNKECFTLIAEKLKQPCKRPSSVAYEFS